WLRSQGCEWNVNTFIKAVEKMSLTDIKWLKSEGCPFDKRVFNEAILNERFDILKWIIGNNYDRPDVYDSSVMEYGCDTKNLDMLQYLHDLEYKMDENTFETAADIGDLDVLKWLKKNGCRWNDNTFAAAKELEVIEWLHYNGCPKTSEVFSNMAITGNLECLKWMKIHNFPFD